MVTEEQKEKFAELIVKTGAGVKKGQTIIIRAQVELEDFVALVSRKCYEAGAKNVFIHWQSQKVDKADYTCAALEDLSKVTPFEKEAWKYFGENLCSLIWLDGEDPDGLSGIDAGKFATVKQLKYKVIGKYKKMTENTIPWCIAGVPTRNWAKKVFPEAKSDEEAMDKLWEAILYTSRALDGNGIENWKKHEEDLKTRCKALNALRLKKLHYVSKNGTDLTVGLIPGVIFLGGGEKDIAGDFFEPNIPSEECFTSPLKGAAEGIVYSTKPLIYQGQRIEDFSVRFHKGKAVEVHARIGEEVLKSILTLDKGSAYLGECALVPVDSPISQSNILFYNTLFDENASCHLALGTGFTSLYPGFEKLGDKEVHKKGINFSQSHVDFMIGSDSLSITGTTEDGKDVPIFRNGTWAF